MGTIRTDHFSYIHNFKPERWPSGHPDGSVYGPAYSEVNESPTNGYIIEHKDERDMEIYWQLSFGLRPADELYSFRLDPYQMHNVADRAEYADTFDQYEYLGRLLQKP